MDPYATEFPGSKLVEPFSASLELIDPTLNAYKFYIMQLLEHDTDYVLFTRYGHVYDNGKIRYYKSDIELVEKFKSIFKSKTGNTWDDAFFTNPIGSKPFVHHQGKYSLK